MWPSGHVKIEMEVLSIAHRSTMCQWVKIDVWRISCTVCPRFMMRNIAWLLFISSTFYYHGLTLIPAWICNRIHYKVWIEITYPFLNFNGATVEYLEWMINFIPHITRHAGIDAKWMPDGVELRMIETLQCNILGLDIFDFRWCSIQLKPS